jgi:hypothetical protein
MKEPSKTFNAVLSNPANAILGTPTVATVGIIDNDKRVRTPRLASPRRRVTF